MNEYFRGIQCENVFDGVVEQMLIEGITTSYDVHKLKETLEAKFGDKVSIKLPDKVKFKKHNFDYRAYSFPMIGPSDDIFKHQLKQILNLFGYFIISDKEKNKYNVYNIEPRHPIKINDILKKRNIKCFYHITPKSNLSKIEKIGLTPRGTETSFYHPDDRIYLVSTSLNDLKRLMQALADNKKLKVDDMAVLEIPYNDKYDYYLDDLATIREADRIAVFVLKNIRPNELKIINI